MYNDIYIKNLYRKFIEEYKLSSDVAERILFKILEELFNKDIAKRDSS